MKIDCVIGIDPGSSGGMAVKRDGEYMKVYKMPKELKDLTELFNHYKDISDKVIVFIEKVQLRHDDMGGGKAFRIQEMLMNFQRLKDLIEFAEIPYIQVHPMSWQSFLKLRRKGEEKPDRKNRYKSFAQTLYPEVRATLWNSDAMLLVRFGLKKIEIDENWIYENLPTRTHKLFS